MKTRASRNASPLEVMAGITIFCLVMAVLYSGYRLGVRSWESGERAQAAVAKLRLGGSLVRSHIAQAVSLSGGLGDARQVWFEGEAKRLVFVTAMGAQFGSGGLYEMTLVIDERKEGAALVLSRRLLRSGVGFGIPGFDDQSRDLIDQLESAEFTYFGAAEAGGDASWRTRWASRQRLPRLVRLRMVSKLIGVWPEIVIRLPAEDDRYRNAAALRAQAPLILPGESIPWQTPSPEREYGS
jgi:hypothetical protein